MYVEGEVVSTMGNTYHQKCFTCSRCNKPFQSGSKVSYLIKLKINQYFSSDSIIFKPFKLYNFAEYQFIISHQI